MDNICSGLIRSYDINVKSGRKTKGFYIIISPAGKYCLKKTNDDFAHLEFQIQIQENLKNSGMANFEKIYLTKDNKPFAEAGGIKYILTDYTDGEEADFDNEEHLDGIIKALAVFHKNAGVLGESTRYNAQDMRKISRKYYNELDSMKKRIDPSKGLSEFDMLFLKNCDYYMNNALTCEKILSGGQYGEKHENAVNKGCICYNLLKKANLIMSDGEAWLASFSGCRRDYYTKDIAALIERYMKYSKSKAFSPEDIINKYSNYSPVDKDDRAIILAELLSPEGFVKIAGEYYSKKRSWVPTSIIFKMEKIISTKATNAEYLRPFFGVVK